MSVQTRLLPIIVALSVALSVAQATGADAKKTNSGPKGSAGASAPVEQEALADRLARYGIKAADSVAVVQAAKMKLSIAKRVFSGKKRSVSETVKTAKKTGIDLSPEALLKRAESMSGANPVVKELIKDARASKSRGSIRGPEVREDDVAARNSDVYEITFRGGEQAAVFVSGDGDTDLDLYVADENGNEVCSETDETDAVMCRWTPIWTGKFQVRVKNLGPIHNHYWLMVN